MGISNSPLQLAFKCNGAGTAIGGVQAKATGAAALMMKKSILAAAEGRPKHRGSWVKYTVIPGPEHSIAEVALRGGFAHLAERGSYKRPSGWPIYPKGSSRGRGRRRNPKQALKTPYGPMAMVHHPPIAAQPFWDQGVNRALPLVARTYEGALFGALHAIF